MRAHDHRTPERGYGTMSLPWCQYCGEGPAYHRLIGYMLCSPCFARMMGT